MFNEGRNAEIDAITKNIEEMKKTEYMLTARKDIVEILRVRLARLYLVCVNKTLLIPRAPSYQNNENKQQHIMGAACRVA